MLRFFLPHRSNEVLMFIRALTVVGFVIAAAPTVSAQETVSFTARLFDVSLTVPADRWRISWYERYHGDELGFSVDNGSHTKAPRVKKRDAPYVQVQFIDKKKEAHFFFTAEPPRDGYSSLEDLKERYLLDKVVSQYVRDHSHWEDSRKVSTATLPDGQTVDVVKIVLNINGNWRNVTFASFTRGETWYWYWIYNSGVDRSLDEELRTILDGTRFLSDTG